MKYCCCCSGRYYYWNTETDEVSWLSPQHPRAVITLSAERLKGCTPSFVCVTVTFILQTQCLQWFDTVDWVTGRTDGLLQWSGIGLPWGFGPMCSDLRKYGPVKQRPKVVIVVVPVVAAAEADFCRLYIYVDKNLCKSHQLQSCLHSDCCYEYNNLLVFDCR